MTTSKYPGLIVFIRFVQLSFTCLPSTQINFALGIEYQGHSAQVCGN